MRSGKISLLLFLPLISLFLAVAGGFAFVQEARCTVGVGASDIERVQRLVNDEVHLAFSDQCTQAVLEDCFLAIGSVYGRASGQNIRDKLLNTCDGLAGEVLNRAPVHSYAWLIRATVAGERANWGDMQTALQTSQEASPNSGWLSRRRFIVGEQHYGQLDEQGRAVHSRDIIVAVQTEDGRNQVAIYYNQRRETRERIIQAVETLSVNQQRAFLAKMRSVAASLSAYGSG